MLYVTMSEDDEVISRGTERDFSNVVVESNILFKSLSVMSTEFYFFSLVLTFCAKEFLWDEGQFMFFVLSLLIIFK